jgi:starch-binding outer membrane protein, SusD/RagB family
MKKIKFLFIAFTGVLIINSCAEKDLNLKNPNIDPNSASLELIVTKESQVAGMVLPIYNNIRAVSMYGRLIPYMMDNMAQENGKNPQEEADKVTYAAFSFTPSTTDISNYWTACYGGIRKCNFVIENTELIRNIADPSFSISRKNRYIGEARFMRALYYFLLVNRFGGIPIVTKSPKSLDDVKGRATKDEVYALIIDDLRFAESVLLDKSGEANGIPNKGAAQGLLGKVLLYKKDYAGSLATFNKMSGYSLTADYYDNFKEETEYGSESVFEIDYDLSRGTGNKWGDNVSADATATGNNTFRGQDYGHLDWFNVWPSDDLANSFESGDKRIAGTIYNYGDKYLNDTETVQKYRPVLKRGKPVLNPDGTPKTTDDFSGLAPRAWKKYQNYYKQPSENQESGINMKYMRYADVLLMKAECENEIGSQATAIGYINQVRARAGVPALPTSLSKSDVFSKIIKERKVELAGEQVRFDDIMRWGNAETELKGSAFKKGKNELWPIPADEFNNNFKLTAADQNPGY